MSTYSRTTQSGYKMPLLLYPTSALSPVISQATIECHYGKHLQTYVDNLNKFVSDTEFEGLTLREIVAQAPICARRRAFPISALIAPKWRSENLFSFRKRAFSSSRDHIAIIPRSEKHTT